MKPVAIAMSLLLPGLLADHSVCAQEAPPKRTLDTLLRSHRDAIEAASRSDKPDAVKTAIQAMCKDLRQFMEHEAEGDAVHHARFELVQALMSRGDTKAAQTALEAFPAESAPPAISAQAAYLADSMGMKKTYERWVSVALSRAKSFDDRMELGVPLMSILRKPALATALYEKAFAAAKTDEERATVLWHHARATREREDIPETAYDDMLAKLAKEYPKTRFGSIAADRIRAREFALGADPIPIRVNTLSGNSFDLADQKGKSVLVLFWIADDPRCATAVETLQEIYKQYQDQGLVVLGISLDRSAKRAHEAVKAWRTTFPQAFVDGGFESDLALRYRVEDVPFAFLIGKDGKIHGKNFVLHDEAGRKQVIDAVRSAVGVEKKKQQQ